jgi:RNA polymerase sigma-70 factor, ECF subfamily
MDELTVIAAARRGDVDAFNRLVVAHQSRAYNLAYRLLNDQEAAADATQEAFIAAFRRLETYRGEGFQAWLMRIVSNICYDELRRRKRRPHVSIDSPTAESDEPLQIMADPEEGPEQQAHRTALSQIIQDCLQSLPKEFRVVAILADQHEMEYAEIAEATETSLGTVKSRLSRARLKLRECLQSADDLLPAQYRFKRPE